MTASVAAIEEEPAKIYQINGWLLQKKVARGPLTDS